MKPSTHLPAWLAIALVAAPPSTPTSEGDATTGVYLVELRLPDFPASVCLQLVDAYPVDFARTRDPRVLRGGTLECWYEETLDGGDRGTAEVRLAEVPLNTPLWLCVFWDSYVDGALRHGVEPTVMAVPPLTRSDEPGRVALWPRPRGAIRGGVTGEALDIGVRLGGQTAPVAVVEDGRYWLWPLAAGRHQVDVLAEGPAVVHRRVLSANVRDGAATDLGTWSVGSTPSLRLQATDEDGLELEGCFVIDLRGFPPACIRYSAGGPVRLCGDWRDIERVRFEPRDLAAFEPVAVTDVAGPWLTLACRRRAERSVSFSLCALLPGGEREYRPAWGLTRDDSRDPWRPVQLGGHSGGCVVYRSHLFEPGRHEIVAWQIERGLSFQGELDVPRDTGDLPVLQVPFEDPGTVLRCYVQPTCAGVPIEWHLSAWLLPDGAPLVLPRRWAPDPLYVSPGPLELRGIPPGIDLWLVLGDRDEDGAVFARRKLRLERGERLDLGRVEVRLP